MTIRTLVLAFWAAAFLCGCASSNTLVITTSAQHAREVADKEQRTADQYRALGAPDAARQAQQRAYDYRASAEKKPDGFFAWLADTLFFSWLSTQAASAGVRD